MPHRSLRKLLAPLLLAACAAAHAQTYPARPITLIVPFPPGGGNDNVARLVAAKASEGLGQSVVIDNKPGAGTLIGSQAAAKAAPDGYTLFFGSIASHAISPNLYKSVPYDPVKDFEPVTLLATAPTILVTSPEFPFTTVKDIVAAAKKNPGKYTFASAGAGSPPHLSGEIFKQMAGIDLVHVPYKGGTMQLQDVMGGRVDMIFDTAASSMGHVKGGKLKAIAIARPTRLPDMPNLPTFAEAGYPDYRPSAWYGILAPAGTPKPIIDRLNQEFVKALATPQVKERLATLGTDAVGNSPQEFGTFIKSELGKYGKVIKDVGATAE